MLHRRDVDDVRPINLAIHEFIRLHGVRVKAHNSGLSVAWGEYPVFSVAGGFDLEQIFSSIPEVKKMADKIEKQRYVPGTDRT